VENKNKTKDVSEIAQDVFDEYKIRDTRILHVETHLLNHIISLETSESDITESTGGATTIGLALISL
jgi:hypothetical protein